MTISVLLTRALFHAQKKHLFRCLILKDMSATGQSPAGIILSIVFQLFYQLPLGGSTRRSHVSKALFSEIRTHETAISNGA